MRVGQAAGRVFARPLSMAMRNVVILLPRVAPRATHLLIVMTPIWPALRTRVATHKVNRGLVKPPTRESTPPQLRECSSAEFGRHSVENQSLGQLRQSVILQEAELDISEDAEMLGWRTWKVYCCQKTGSQHLWMRPMFIFHFIQSLRHITFVVSLVLL